MGSFTNLVAAICCRILSAYIEILIFGRRGRKWFSSLLVARASFLYWAGIFSTQSDCDNTQGVYRAQIIHSEHLSSTADFWQQIVNECQHIYSCRMHLIFVLWWPRCGRHGYVLNFKAIVSCPNWGAANCSCDMDLYSNSRTGLPKLWSCKLNAAVNRSLPGLKPSSSFLWRPGAAKNHRGRFQRLLVHSSYLVGYVWLGIQDLFGVFSSAEVNSQKPKR